MLVVSGLATRTGLRSARSRQFGFGHSAAGHAHHRPVLPCDQLDHFIGGLDFDTALIHGSRCAAAGKQHQLERRIVDGVDWVDTLMNIDMLRWT